MNRTLNSLIESSRQWLMSPAFRYAALACYLVVLGFLSLNPWVRPASEDGIFSPDKIWHALAYGGLAIIAFLCVAKARNGSARSTICAWSIALVLSVFTGILIEIAQSLFTTTRVGSAEDAVANTIGAALGCVAYQVGNYLRVKIAGA